jgi:hypothetical protein
MKPHKQMALIYIFGGYVGGILVGLGIAGTYGIWPLLPGVLLVLGGSFRGGLLCSRYMD